MRSSSGARVARALAASASGCGTRHTAVAATAAAHPFSSFAAAAAQPPAHQQRRQQQQEPQQHAWWQPHQQQQRRQFEVGAAAAVHQVGTTAVERTLLVDTLETVSETVLCAVGMCRPVSRVCRGSGGGGQLAAGPQCRAPLRPAPSPTRAVAPAGGGGAVSRAGRGPDPTHHPAAVRQQGEAGRELCHARSAGEGAWVVCVWCVWGGVAAGRLGFGGARSRCWTRPATHPATDTLTCASRSLSWRLRQRLLGSGQRC